VAELIYLAYGSNLHPLRLQQRVPSCRLLGPVSLPGYRLVFHKIGMDDSGKCDLLETGYPDDIAYAVLFSMDDADKPALDIAEGPSYYCANIDVVFEGEAVEVLTYLAKPDRQDPNMVPFDWYRELVLIGARLNRFPESYIAAIEQVPTIADPDVERNRLNQQLIAAMQSDGF
jgi:hypothetical protein